MKSFRILLIALLSAATPLLAEGLRIQLPPENPQLKPGPQADMVMASCLVCHSWDYVTTQPVLPRTTWKAIVTKMKVTFGAPLADDRIEPIVDYLVRAYGNEQAVGGANQSPAATTPRT